MLNNLLLSKQLKDTVEPTHLFSYSSNVIGILGNGYFSNYTFKWVVQVHFNENFFSKLIWLDRLHSKLQTHAFLF